MKRIPDGENRRLVVIAFFMLVFLQIIIICVNYKNINMSYPIIYSGGDDFGVFFYAKTIDHYGISLNNPQLGGNSGFNMYDYPYADSLSYTLVKIIGVFSDNPFFVINVFYFLCSIIVAMVSFYVMHRRGMGIPLAMALSLLFANSSFFQQRYAHMWLIPYFMIPLECDIAMDILEDSVLGEGRPIIKNPNFLRCFFISFLCAFTGLYYAFFACVLFFASYIIKSIRDNSIKRNSYSLLFILSTIIGVAIQYIPNLLYFSKHGVNPGSEMSVRQIGDAEVYGMKLVQLILPRLGHRINILYNISAKYLSNYPLVNENSTSAIGIIATIGLLLAGYMIIKREETNRNEPILILSVFLVATIGGIGSLFSLLIYTPMRSYNRMSLVIMFLCLLLLGKSIQSKFDRNSTKLIEIGACMVLLVVGVFDQTVPLSLTSDTVSQIEDQKAFMSEIDMKMDAGSLIFQYPYIQFPSGSNYKMFIGYLYTDDLRWSYGAMQGREEAMWQESVASESPEDMIGDIVENGYRGLYFDKAIYDGQNKDIASEDLISQITEIVGIEPIMNGGGDLFFWDLTYYVDNYSSIETEDAA